MNLKYLSILLTDRCSAACRICCFQCNPHNTFVMDESVMKRYIDEAARIGTVQSINFTGGEAMLYPDLLKKMVQYAMEKHNLPSSVVSNGFWAADEQRGRKLIRELLECGLKAIRLSADRYHQEFVPPSTLKKAIRILFEAGLLEDISVMDTKGGPNIRFVTENLRPEIYLVPKISLYPALLPEKTLTNAELDVGPADLLMPTPWDQCYCEDNSGVVLYKDGYIYNCCSQFAFEIPRLRLGKIGEITLAEACKKVNRDPILEIMRRDSVSWFARKALERNLDVQRKEAYSGSCELCRDMLCNRNLMEELTPLAQEEVWKRRLEKIWGMDGKEHE